ncbi:MAG: ribosomal protein S18-alanine N-acetyltransferase [Methylophilaceae bacterium]
MNVELKSDYVLRPMQEEDLDDIMQIEPSIYLHPWTRGNFNDSLKAGHKAWVTTLEGTIIGYTLMMLVLDEAHLLNISVAAPYQKQGLGRVLLTHMIERAKESGVLNMFLEVRSSNVSAITLYEKMGFVETSGRRGYYPAKDGREDAVLMGLGI